jgi:uncharacterized phage protein (TIGR02218 family)
VVLTTVSAVDSRGVFTLTDLNAYPSQYFQFGVCKFVTGVNSGFARDIADNADQPHVTMMIPFMFLPQVGDKCLIVVGCDKKITTCHTKFANTLNNRGFPQIPGTDQYFKVGVPGGAGTASLTDRQALALGSG